VAVHKPGVFEDLKRRHVWRVAIAYAVVAWLLLQLLSIVFPTFGAPAWVLKVVTVLLAAGFPVALVLAWAFEVTPEGVRRTEPADSPQSRPEDQSHRIGRTLNTGIIVALILAVGLLGWRLMVLRHAPAAPAQAAGATRSSDEANPHPGTIAPDSAAGLAAAGSPRAPSTPVIPARSIAVLPFENLSTDKGNAYFADGIQDLILTKLADINDLKVIARTSTAMYKSHPANLTKVGEQLGVATILEGSVQKAGNQVLINVQLINAKTDAHIWAKAYTRTLDNVFGVEGEVAGKIASALDAKLSPAQSADLAAVPTTNKAAYDLYLRAEYAANQSRLSYVFNRDGFKNAIPLYRQAVQADPGFALAWARLSYTESELAWLGGGEHAQELAAQARKDAERALQLAPHLADAQLALGYCDYYGRGDYPAALKAFAEAHALKPNDSDALAARGYVERRMGHFDAAIASLQKAFALDPRNSILATELGTTYMMVSRYPQAEDAFRRALALDPGNLNAQNFYPYAVLFGTGDVARALAAAQGDSVPMRLARSEFLTYQRKYREALAVLDAIPDTPANFPPVNGASKVQAEADLYSLMGDKARARALYAQDLPKARAQIGHAKDMYSAERWGRVADDELGLGHTASGIAAVAKAQAIVDKFIQRHNDIGPSVTEYDASFYANAGRADLAVPLLARALAMPSGGIDYSPVMLWLDPWWDPIRQDPRFQALEKKYAKYKPAVIYPVPAASAPQVAHG
jgi:TolB-like protein